MSIGNRWVSKIFDVSALKNGDLEKWFNELESSPGTHLLYAEKVVPIPDGLFVLVCLELTEDPDKEKLLAQELESWKAIHFQDLEAYSSDLHACQDMLRTAREAIINIKKIGKDDTVQDKLATCLELADKALRILEI